MQHDFAVVAVRPNALVYNRGVGKILQFICSSFFGQKKTLPSFFEILGNLFCCWIQHIFSAHPVTKFFLMIFFTNCVLWSSCPLLGNLFIPRAQKPSKSHLQHQFLFWILLGPYVTRALSPRMRWCIVLVNHKKKGYQIWMASKIFRTRNYSTVNDFCRYFYCFTSVFRTPRLDIDDMCMHLYVNNT